MKKKKGSKKKKKSSKVTSKLSSEIEDESNVGDSPETTTLMSGDTQPSGKKKKKKGGKKKKLSKSEKALQTLEKKAEKLKGNAAQYDSFINRIHQWMLDNTRLALEMFKHFDSDGLISYDQFKAAMFDLNAPVNKVELHLMCKLLDKEDAGEIDYKEFANGLQFIKELREIDRQRVHDETQLLLTQRKFPACPCCKMLIVEPWRETLPRYILLELRCVTFDMIGKYPGHLKLLVHSHLPVCGLIQMIIAETDISSSKIAVFRDTSRSPESVLPPTMTLEECGFVGEVLTNCEERVLYYDYTVEFTDCPILMCDHYFGQKVKI